MKNKTDFGMPVLIEMPSVIECAELCNNLGLDFIELNMNLPQYQIHNLNIEELAKTAFARGIYYTLHLDENLNVLDFNKLVSDAYINTVVLSVKAAKILEIPILNIHLNNGVYFTLPDKKVYLFEKYNSLCMERLKIFRNVCEKEIGASNIKICIENCGGFSAFSQHVIEYLLESGVFGLTFDIGHSHAAGGVDEDFILRNKRKLFHMHIHDAKGSKDHLAAGDGEIDIKGRLELAAENNCRCVLETKTAESLRRSVEKIKNLY